MLPLMMREFMLLLLLSVSQAAPKDGATRSNPEALQQPLPNPFVPGQEQLRLLQSYLKGLERMEEEPGHMNREQVLLYLFALHDYDQSGQLDGLELLSMLTAALAPGATDSSPTNPVILVVDKVLETQDLNGDGLMTPAELINFPGETPRHQELHDIGRQPLLPRSPLGQEAPEAPSLREAGEQIEARRVSLEAGGLAKAEVGALGPREEAGGPAEVGEGPGPKGEAGEQAEARDTAEEAEELPGETLESQHTPQEFEDHSIQLENDEI
ncbi:PREDICTED: cell growth regulator with EF hand domain protein 1 [Chrysochloris asiatica]|uniref:Cell growth regulator with EF hand domain protein 1 n=1 Tax=Chrysochloris asiatica TaxID=185453 RepID=A0A9B0WHN0_CHRAS|nr:PREDICTED: cell growth regulator with EF hand domain protein 1 [Chrysochloris asiatica]